MFDKRILFMGTPAIASVYLKSLIELNCWYEYWCFWISKSISSISLGNILDFVYEVCAQHTLQFFFVGVANTGHVFNDPVHERKVTSFPRFRSDKVISIDSAWWIGQAAVCEKTNDFICFLAFVKLLKWYYSMQNSHLCD